MESTYYTPTDLAARVARASDLVPNEGGFPDSDLPGCRRTLSNILGFQPPDRDSDGNGAAVMSPIGAKASASAPIKIREGFNLAYLDAEPGNGTLLHNHDTTESFVVITGRWRFRCNDEDDVWVDLGPGDTVSFPPGLPRRFTLLANTETGPTSRLLVIITGDTPIAVMEPDVLAAARETGRFTPVHAA